MVREDVLQGGPEMSRSSHNDLISRIMIACRGFSANSTSI